MKFEIINPSDKCYIHGDIVDDKEALCAVALILGNGSYALVDADGETLIPILTFDVPLEWWTDEFCRTLDDSLSDIGNIERMARIFESFEYDGERTSMNDIGARAKDNAKNHREFLQKEAPDEN